MAEKAEVRKLKLLLLRKVLLEESDAKHPLSQRELSERLAQAGCPAERKALYRDIAILREMGLDVVYQGGADGGYFVGERPLEVAELKLLIDAVQAAQFITPARTDRLIARLTGLVSRHQAKVLRRHLWVDRRLKTDSDQVCHNAERIHSAMDQGRAVTFRYTAWNAAGEKVLRHGGMKYIVSPKALIWNQERYYMAGWDHGHQEMRHYRVDKMQDVLPTGLPQKGPDLASFDPDAYAVRHFGMFRGRQAQVTLLCQSQLAGVIRDRFGRDVPLTPLPSGGFQVTVEVEVSPQFYGWLFGLNGKATLTDPYWAVRAYKDALLAALDAHKPFQNQSHR